MEVLWKFITETELVSKNVETAGRLHEQIEDMAKFTLTAVTGIFQLINQILSSLL